MKQKILFSTVSLCLLTEELFSLFYGQSPENLIISDNKNNRNNKSEVSKGDPMEDFFVHRIVTAHGMEGKILSCSNYGTVMANIDVSNNQKIKQLQNISELVLVKDKINQFVKELS